MCNQMRGIFDELCIDYRNRGVLTTQFLTHYAITKVSIDHYAIDIDRVDEAVATFDKHVFNKWVQKYYNDAETRGSQFTFKGITMRMWGSAGRLLVTLEGERNQSVTVIGLDTGKTKIGIQGIEATPGYAAYMLKSVALHSNVFKKGMAADSSVTIAPLAGAST
jgi:hypothetical protein